MSAAAKKSFAEPMAEAYDPGAVESSWDKFWESHDLYKPDESDPKKEPFVIVLPPPNVTGSLHLGHALTAAIEDSVVRWHRMNGKAALWVPGVDHAGIATQVVVEKQLARTRGVSRHDLGREKFLDAVWEWKDKYASRITTQMRSLGTSVDWSRERFTMDEMCAAAVKEAFVRMHAKGKIYRDNRLVSWSCALRSAISSIEVEHHDVESETVTVPGHSSPVEVGVIHSFSYKVKGSEETITVATTRIETMLGDVAVAVHSSDERYKHLVGKELEHPFLPQRKVVVITDDALVDPAFGTGAVKITPAHDPNDYACGKRHSLPFINILDDGGCINENGGEMFAGMHRFAAREAVIAALQSKGLYKGKAPNKMSIGFCSRTNDIVEPIVRPQWWVDCAEAAARAVKAVETQQQREKDAASVPADAEALTILPAAYRGTWFQWLNNIQDWCISRQLWWGHRIPAYYASPADAATSAMGGADEDASRWIIADSKEAAEAEAARRFPGEKLTLEQDPDVLDTWFSSGLFPFSVMGWPNTEAADMAKYFPGHLLETGGDILFFWVARMVMMSTELTDKLPFTTVYLHSIVRDRIGRKMSKSLGNVIDPLHVIYGITLQDLQATLAGGNLAAKEVETAQATQAADFPQGIPACGADALRFGLLGYTRQGGDINLDIARIVAARAFCNKMWQATRFALRSFPEDFVAPENVEELQQAMQAAGGPTTAQTWILSRLHAAIVAVDEGFASYTFGGAVEAVQVFFVEELCARYLEMIKPYVRADTLAQGTAEDAALAQSLLATMFYCLDTILRAMHPMMPFVTEELWHRLPGHAARVAKRIAAAGGEAAADKRVLAGSIMVAPFPTPAVTGVLASPTAEADMAVVDLVVGALRSAKASVGLKNAQKPNVIIAAKDAAVAALLGKEARAIATLAFVGAVTADGVYGQCPAGAMTVVVSGDIVAYVVIEGLVDAANEAIKLERKLRDVASQQATLQLAMNAPAYANCKPEIREKNAAKSESNLAEMAALEAGIANFTQMVPRKAYINAKLGDLAAETAKVLKGAEKQGVKGEAELAAWKPAPLEEGKKAPKGDIQLAALQIQYNELAAEALALRTELLTL